LGKGHYLDEEGGLRQILLQHTKRGRATLS
jgi:hypothetical protein